jgi:hypothetical protein
MNYYFIKLLKKKDRQIENLKKENEYLRNFGLYSLTFNVSMVMSFFVSLAWGAYTK